MREGGRPQFDLAVADEAHRCAGRVGTEFTTILNPDQIKSRRRLFMTATPRLYTPRVRREAGQIDVEVASMDDEAVFGPVLHRLSFGAAIERALLSDYQVVVVGVDNETYRTYAERGEFVTRDGEAITDARTLADEAVVGGIASLRVLAGEAEQIDQLLPEVLELALTPYLGTAEARRIISAG